MRLIARFRLSPAIVIASIALFVALAGTSAATVTLIGKNTVASPQVVNGSLKKEDFKAGLIGSGGAGPSTFSRSVTEVQLENRPTPIATLRIPQPGKYVVWAKANFRNRTGSDGAVCDLVAGDAKDRTYVYQTGVAAVSVASVVVGDLKAAGEATFACSAGINNKAIDIRVTAIKVGNLTRS